MKINLHPIMLGMLFGMLSFSCVRDTDFDQAEEVTLTPKVELNLIHFDLDAGEFFDSITNTPRLVLSDTTLIRLLDDIEVQESLYKADFEFRFTNSIPREFQTDFTFLSSQGIPTYSTSTLVTAGNPDIPALTTFIQTVEGQDIIDLTQSDKVVVTVTIPSADLSLEGNLNLKSKTTYYLEIKDRN